MFLQASLSGGKEACQQTEIKLQLLQPTLKRTNQSEAVNHSSAVIGHIDELASTTC